MFLRWNRYLYDIRSVKKKYCWSCKRTFTKSEYMNFSQKRRDFHFVQEEPSSFSQNVTVFFTQFLFFCKHFHLTIIVWFSYPSETLQKRHCRYCFFTRSFFLFTILLPRRYSPENAISFLHKGFLITISRHSSIMVISQEVQKQSPGGIL